MNKPLRLLISLIATVFSLVSMVIGIMLVNSLTFPFWRMICYDLVFVGQFLTFLWCAVLYSRADDSDN